MRKLVPRIVLLALALAAVAVAAVLYARRADPYTVTAYFQDAGQVVKGNQVRIAGATIGTVSAVRLADDGQAAIELKIQDGDYEPLHEGTRAVLRNSALASVAGRIIALEPGPNNAPKIASGGTIAATDTRSATDIDQVLNAIDAKGRRYLQTLVRGGATALDGAEPAANEALERLNPALAQTRRTVDELRSDEPALQRIIASSAAVADTLATNKDDLEQGLESTAVTLRASASEREALRSTIRRAPDFIRRANTTFASTRALLDESQPLLRELRPVAPRLARTLRLAEPLTREATPLLRDIRASLPALTDVLQKSPGFANRVVPALSELSRTLEGYAPIVTEVRRYAPDLSSGLLTGFGGKSGGYYDANGHYARIAPVLNSAGLPELLRPVLGGLVDVLGPLLGTGLTVPQTNQTNRCPGGGAQTHPDGSNPNPAGHDGRCDVTQVPLGGSNPVTPAAK
ncbi:MlaD family protein [Patulibacter sp. S7RM1-6]